MTNDENDFDWSLDEKEIRFLTMNNALENIYRLDYLAFNKEKEGQDYAWKFLRHKAKNKQIPTLEDMCFIQKLITDEQAKIKIIIPEYARGVFRGPSNKHNVTSRGREITANYLEVPRYMKDFQEQFVKRFEDGVDPITNMSHTNFAIERIHPFLDGNSRTARLWAGFIRKYGGEAPLIHNSPPKYNKALNSIGHMKVYYEKLDENQDFS